MNILWMCSRLTDCDSTSNITQHFKIDTKFFRIVTHTLFQWVMLAIVLHFTAKNTLESYRNNHHHQPHIGRITVNGYKKMFYRSLKSDFFRICLHRLIEHSLITSFFILLQISFLVHVLYLFSIILSLLKHILLNIVRHNICPRTLSCRFKNIYWFVLLRFVVLTFIPFIPMFNNTGSARIKEAQIII